MLVLSRKNQEAVVVGNAGGLERLLTVTVLEIRGGKVKLGFDVAPEMPVHRQEVWDRIQAEGEHEGPMTLPIVPAPR
jgi:carbon storage regulator